MRSSWARHPRRAELARRCAGADGCAGADDRAGAVQLIVMALCSATWLAITIAVFVGNHQRPTAVWEGYRDPIAWAVLLWPAIGARLSRVPSTGCLLSQGPAVAGNWCAPPMRAKHGLPAEAGARRAPAAVPGPLQRCARLSGHMLMPLSV